MKMNNQRNGRIGLAYAPGCLFGGVALLGSLALGAFGLMVMFSGCGGN